MITIAWLLQYLLSFLIIISAIYVVVSGNLVRAAFALFFTLSGLAGFYLTLGADLLAGFQVLVYVGGILIIILFGVMLTQRYFEINIRVEPLRVLPALIISLIIFILVGIAGIEVLFLTRPEQSLYAPPIQIGFTLVYNYLLPFELASVVLLVVLIGAAVLTRREVSGR